MKVCLAVIVSVISMFTASARIWTDSLGREFEGSFIRLEGTTVVLNVNGLQRKFPLQQLSPKDRQWVQQTPNQPSSTSRHQQTTRTSPFPPARPFVPRAPAEIRANLTVPVKRIEANPTEKRWVYASPHFEFVCNDDLGLATVREFVWMFESVWQLCKGWPIRLPRLDAKEQVRMRTLLVKEFSDYVRLGGPPGSAGVYLPARDLILIPYNSLGIKESSYGYKIDRRMDNYVLRHEITHQLMRGQTQQAAWFIEGSAEYIATVPFQVNRMLLSHHRKAVADYLTGFGRAGKGGHNLGRAIKLPPLETFMTSSYGQFQRIPDSYAYALIVFYYFAKMDGAKDGAGLHQYAEALHRDRSEKQARQLLLAGRSWEQLESDIAAAWNLVGVRLQFGK